MTKILGIIPARYASSRFPGKALADIQGKVMIQRVYEQTLKAKKLSAVIVATDNNAIFTAVNNFGGTAIMTKAEHPSGTDRCFEALQKDQCEYDYVINIQGDEPFIDPKQIDLLAELLDGHTQIATLIKKITHASEIANPNVVKVVFDKNGKALLFSRSTIPFVRSLAQRDWHKHPQPFYKHIGIYGYRSDILSDITKLERSPLELSESLEQLRWLENGYTIKVTETHYESIGIDTPEDLERIKDFR